MAEIDLDGVPGYREAYARHRVQRKELTDGGDETAVAKLDGAWAQEVSRFTGTFYELREQGRSTELALAQAKADFPQADPATYSHLTTPETIAAAAKASQERVAAIVEEQKQNWGASGAGAGTAPPAKTTDDRLVELVPAVLKGKAGERENEQFRQILFTDKVGSRFKDLMPPAQGGAA